MSTTGFAAAQSSADEVIHNAAKHQHDHDAYQHSNDHSYHDRESDARSASRSPKMSSDVMGMPDGDVDDIMPSPGQRMLSACGGSLLTSLIVTPLDVVRVRLQSQQPVAAPPVGSTSSLRTHKFPLQFKSSTPFSEFGATTCCREVFWHNSVSEACIAPSLTASNFTESCVVQEVSRRRFEGTWEGLTKIARYEGITTLWRGLSPTLLMAVPANVIYFTGFDTLRTSRFSPFSDLNPVLAPLLAGGSARAIAATMISPLELFKTRLQATSTHSHGSRAFSETLDGVKEMVIRDGVRSLWRGLSLTLWRDVPFSGVYWAGYEAIKKELQAERKRLWQLSKMHDYSTNTTTATTTTALNKRPPQNTFVDSFIAGAISGAAAAFLTSPFDVGKTRRQISMHKGERGAGSMPRVLLGIWREEGVAGLWKGCAPRMMKVAPACAIMISSYELGKSYAKNVTDRRLAGE